MSHCLLHKHLAFFAAAALFIVASGGAAIAYGGMLRRNAAERLFADGLPAGPRTIFALSGGRCAGRLDFNLQRKEEKMAFDAEGKLRVDFAGRRFELTLMSAAQFNSLMQLGAAVLTIDSGEASIVLGLENINPMTFTFILRQAGSPEIKHKLPLPGPLLLQQIDADTYTLIYTHIPSAQAAGLLQRMSFMRPADLRLVPADAMTDDCDAQQGAVDVTAAVALLQRFGPQAEQLLGSPQEER